MGQTVTESQGVFGISVPQADFNTGITPSSVTPNIRQIISDGFITPANYTSANVTNQGEATGSAYGTNATKGRADVDGSFSERLTFQALGFHAFRSFGVYAAVVTLAAGVYKHTFLLLNPHTNRVLPASTIVEILNEAAVSSNDIHRYKYRGGTYESLEITTPHNAQKPNLMANVAWRGSGKRESAPKTNIQFFGAGKHVKAPSAENYIKETVGVMNLYSGVGKGGTTYATNCDFYGLTASINENLNTEIGYTGCAKYQDDTNPNSAAVRGEMPATEQTCGVVFTMKHTPELKNNFNFEVARENGDQTSGLLSADWTFKGDPIDGTYFHQAIISLNAFRVESLSYPTIDSVRGLEVTTAPQAINNVMPLTLEIITNVADFSTFVAL